MYKLVTQGIPKSKSLKFFLHPAGLLGWAVPAAYLFEKMKNKKSLIFDFEAKIGVPELDFFFVFYRTSNRNS